MGRTFYHSFTRLQDCLNLRRDEALVHGTCIALRATGALLRGPPGCGKSDLALRFLHLAEQTLGTLPCLVADDQVLLRRIGGRILASCPPQIFGKIEVRGVGIVRVASVMHETDLRVVVDLSGEGSMERLPLDYETEPVLDVPLKLITLDPFEASSPIKLALILQNLLGKAV